MTSTTATDGPAPGVRAGITLKNSPDMFPPVGHYSHIARHGGLAFVSGQLPIAPDGTPLTSKPFHAQAEQVLRNLDACLATAGSSRDCLVSVTVYVADIENWPEFDRLYAAWLGGHRPSRAIASTSALHYGSAVEVHAVAAVD